MEPNPIWDRLDPVEVEPTTGRHLGKEPALSILRDGFLGLNTALFEQLGQPEALVILKDEVGGHRYMILRPAKKTERNALTFTQPQKGRQRVNARKVLPYFDSVDRSRSYRYPIVSFSENDSALIDLDGEKEDVTRS